MKLNIPNTFLILLLLLLLNSCAPDPRNVADAYRTTTLADQTAADQAQARAQDAEAFRQAQAERQTTEQARTWVLNFFIKAMGVVLTLSVCVALAGIGTGISWAGVGMGRAVARFAEVRANLIRLDPETRQFPLVIQYAGQGRFTMHNANTGSVVKLDTRRTEDRQLILSSRAVQLAGMVAREARKSKGTADETGLRSMVLQVQDLFRNTEGDGDEIVQ